MATRKDGLTDRERILTRLIDALALSQTLAPAGVRRWGDECFTGHDGYPYAHFAFWREPKAGDLVLARTGTVSEWKVAFYVEPLPGSCGGAVVREIGTGRLCNYENEQFVPIVGLSDIDLLEGDKYLTYQKVLAAFRAGDEYLYRFGGIEFDGDEVVIWIREAHGGFGKPSEPFSVRMKWNKRTSIKEILAAMRAGGYGTKSFRPEAAEPANEQNRDL